MDSNVLKGFWAEFFPINPATGSPVVIRICTLNTPEATGIDLGGGEFLPYLSSFPNFDISVFDGNFTGSSVVNLTGLEASDINGFALNFGSYVWDGTEVRVYEGTNFSTGLASLTRIFTGSCTEAPSTELGTVSWNIRDRSYLLDVDLFKSTYAGTGGMEGAAEMTGVSKPFVLGKALNIEPVLVDPAFLIYQYHGYGTTIGVLGLYENGLGFGAPLTSVPFTTDVITTYNNLKAVTMDPGEWVDCPSLGMFRLGGEPVSNGVLSLDVRGQTKSPGVLCERIDDCIDLLIALSDAPSDLVDGSSYTGFYASTFNQTVGDYFTESVNLGAVIRSYLSQCGGYYFFSSTGKMRLGLVRLSTPALEIRTDGTTSPVTEDIKAAAVSAPYKRLRMGADRVFKLHSLDEISDALYQLALVSNSLITLTTTHNTFRYNADDVPYAQTTTLKATRQNAAGVTEWRVSKTDGTVLINWNSAATIVSNGGADSAPDNDTLVLDQTRFHGATVANSTTGLIYETRISTATSVQDRVSLIKVRDGDNAITPFLTNESHTLAAAADGTVSSYAGASGTFKIEKNGVDISGSFTLSTVANPQSLTIGYTGMGYSVTAGFDAGEDNASVTIRATGSGAYAGVIIDKVFSLSKSKTGDDGTDGADAFVVTPNIPLVSLSTTTSLIVDPAAQLPFDVQFTAKVGTTDVTGLVTWPEAAVTSCAVTNVGGGLYRLTTAAARNGYFTVPVVYLGRSFTITVPYVKNPAGAASTRVRDDTITNTASGTYVQVSDTLTINFPPSTTMTFGMSFGYYHTAGSADGASARKKARFMYRNVTDSGAWTQAGSELIGTYATADYFVYPTEPNFTSGEVSGSYNGLTAPGSAKVYEVRLDMLYEGTGTLDAISGNFEVTIS